MTQIRTGISDTEARQTICRRLFYLLLLGILLGTALRLRAPALAQSALLRQGMSEPEGVRTLWTVFVRSIGSAVLLVLAAFLCGFSAVGQPAALSLLVLRGAALGVAACGTYAVYGIRGLPVVLFLQLPHAAATALLLLLAVREAMQFSSQLFRFVVCACERDGLREAFRLYLLRFLVLGALLLPVAAADTALTYFLLPRLLA